MNRKLIYALHKWMGLTLGAMVFLLALSGVGITFRHEIMPLVYSSLFHVEEVGTPLPLETILRRTQSYLGEEKAMTNLYASEDDHEAILILYKIPNAAFPTMITINPYTAEVVGEMGMIKNFFAIMLFMHSNFFLGKLGSNLVGIFGLILTFFVISGLYIWIPQKNISQKFKRTFHYTKAHLSQKIHHSFGIIFAIPLLISAITVFLIIFDISYKVMRPINADPVKIEEMERPGSCEFEAQMKSLRFMTPEMVKNLISIHMCTPKNGVMKFSYGLYNHNFLDGYGRLILDPRTETVLQEFNSEKDPSSWNSKRLTIYPIHTGEYLGTIGRVIVLITGLALMGIYITGVTLYIKRRKLSVK